MLYAFDESFEKYNVENGNFTADASSPTTENTAGKEGNDLREFL
ncbi:MAG: hypothetical protein ACLTZM_02540 [Ruminococcus sp.]